MDQIKIEANIPIPPIGGKYELALRKMNVGDSFVTRESSRSHIQREAKKVGCEIVWRNLQNNEIRVWKVSKA